MKPFLLAIVVTASLLSHAQSEPTAVPTIVHFVAPVYPALANTARIKGKVVARLSITTSGSVSQVAIISGHPIFVKSVTDALKQWKFRPSTRDTSLDVTSTFEFGGWCEAQTQVIADLPDSITVAAESKCVDATAYSTRK